MTLDYSHYRTSIHLKKVKVKPNPDLNSYLEQEQGLLIYLKQDGPSSAIHIHRAKLSCEKSNKNRCWCSVTSYFA